MFFKKSIPNRSTNSPFRAVVRINVQYNKLLNQLSVFMGKERQGLLVSIEDEELWWSTEPRSNVISRPESNVKMEIPVLV